MSTIQTKRGTRPKRLHSNLASQDFVENEEQETSLEWYRQIGRNIRERRKSLGLPEEDDEAEEKKIMAEAVAIIKEVRAERYAEEQERKNATGR